MSPEQRQPPVGLLTTEHRDTWGPVGSQDRVCVPVANLPSRFVNRWRP